MADIYAIFASGGKQYRAKVGDTLKLEKLAGNAGDKVEFADVMMIADKIGTPNIAGAKIIGEITQQTRDDKILVFKKKRRQNYRRTRGHRQHLTVVKITEIKA